VNGIHLSSTGSGEDDSEIEVGAVGSVGVGHEGSCSGVEESGGTDSSAEEDSTTRYL